MLIFLVGFMGAGKSSVGKRLSSKLNIPFIDLDEQLEKEEGMSITEIFQSKGEDHFRQHEKNWIENLSDREAVISLGGGTPCQEGIMEKLRSMGTAVYLKPNNGIIVSRLMTSQTKRPLIDAIKDDKSKLGAFVESKLQEREPFYLKSKIILESSDIKAEKLDMLAQLCKVSEQYRV